MRRRLQGVTFTGGCSVRRLLVVFGCIVMAQVGGMGQAASADALTDLNKEFRQTYGAATEAALQSALAARPILINRFTGMTLFVPGEDDPLQYEMDGTVYLAERAVTHSVLTLISRFRLIEAAALSEENRDELQHLVRLLRDAEDEVEAGAEGLNKPDDSLQTLRAVRRMAEGIIQRDAVTDDDYTRLVSITRPLIDRSLHRAAESQLEEFRAQLDAWHAAYPSADWTNAMMFAVGTHQPRQDYLPVQLFKWWLERVGGSADNVYYFEVMVFPPSLSDARSKEVMTLISKIIFDRTAGTIVFGDAFHLQADVLAPAASEIIASWPRE